MKEKNIEVIPEYYIESVDNENKQLISYDEQKIPFDILTIVPTNTVKGTTIETGLVTCKSDVTKVGCIDTGSHRFKYMVSVHVAIDPLPRVTGIKGLSAITGIQGMPRSANEWSDSIHGTTVPCQEDTRGVMPDLNPFLTTLAGGEGEDTADSFLQALFVLLGVSPIHIITDKQGLWRG